MTEKFIFQALRPAFGKVNSRPKKFKAICNMVENNPDRTDNRHFVGRRRLMAGLAVLVAGGGTSFAVSSTAQSPMRDTVSILDYGADNTGAIDCTRAFQNAIIAGNVTFPAGIYKMSWSAIRADVLIPRNRKIVVERGATITNTGGRFTAENVDNVEWQIDGWVRSVAMRAAPSKPSWTASPHERGFIEFADIYTRGQAASGFRVYGTGKVSGDWSGTPNVSNLNAQINRKGIACWNAKNVLVSGLEIFGFNGEAVYASFFDRASHNIVFENINVHDTRFNALNFNAGANSGGCKIVRNKVRNAYSLEASAGEISDNMIDNMVYCGIWTGAGAGAGPLNIRRNNISRSGLHGIAAVFASSTPVAGVTIEDNTVTASAQYSIYTDFVREFFISGNKCIGSGSGAGAYDIGLNHALRGSVRENTFMSPGPYAQRSRIAVDYTNCFDVSVDSQSNVFIPRHPTQHSLPLPGVIGR